MTEFQKLTHATFEMNVKRKAGRPAEVNVGICRYVLRQVTRPV